MVTISLKAIPQTGQTVVGMLPSVLVLWALTLVLSWYQVGLIEDVIRCIACNANRIA